MSSSHSQQPANDNAKLLAIAEAIRAGKAEAARRKTRQPLKGQRGLWQAIDDGSPEARTVRAGQGLLPGFGLDEE